VTHAVVIKSILLYFNGLPLDAYHNIAVSNLSVHELVFGSDRSSVKKVEQNPV
jgi:broad specificity phosphatase PhoE